MYVITSIRYINTKDKTIRILRYLRSNSVASGIAYCRVTKNKPGFMSLRLNKIIISENNYFIQIIYSYKRKNNAVFSNIRCY